MGLDQLAGDGQAQAAGAAGVGAGPVAAPESVEDVGKIFRRDAAAAVSDLYLDAIRCGPGSEGDATAGRCVAQGVYHQVAQHLVQPVGIGPEAQRLASV